MFKDLSKIKKEGFKMKKEIKKMRWIMYATLFIITIILSACGNSETTDVQTKKIVSVAITKPWDSMIPLNTNSNYSRFVYS